MLLGLLLNLLRAMLVPLWWCRRLLLRRKPIWVHLRLDRNIVEQPPALPAWRRWLVVAGREPIVLGQLREFGQTLARDPYVHGVVVEVPHTLRAGWASLVAFRDLVATWRTAGKQVVAYLPDGGGTRELFLALAAERILMAPEATLAVLGLASESMYLKSALDRLGVSVEVQAAGRFKTAAEPLVAEHMSDAQREQRRAILDALHGEVVAALRARGLADAAVARLFEGGLWRGNDAVGAGVVDAVCYPDQLVERLSQRIDSAVDGKRSPIRMMSAAQYRSTFVVPWLRPMLPRPYIAVVAVHGAIGLSTSPRGGGASVPAVTAALEVVRRDRRALAVVLHVDSPGGSALASDHIHREVARLAQTKPVVACFGDVAASGGYYVAAPARRIIAQPTTITGSIGVISAKVVVQDLLQRVGVRPQVMTTHAHADMFSATRPFADDERAIMERESSGLYGTFLRLVAEGRGRPVEQIEPLAAGRVWCGRDALAHGLVDRLGGLDVALVEARGLIEGLTDRAREDLRPRWVTRHVATRGLPDAPDPAAVVLAWLGNHAPDLAVMLQAHANRERVLLLEPWLCEWSSHER